MKAGTSTESMYTYMQVCSNFHAHTISIHTMYLIIFMPLCNCQCFTHTSQMGKVFQCFSSIKLPSSGNNDKQRTNEDGGDSG